MAEIGQAFYSRGSGPTQTIRGTLMLQELTNVTDVSNDETVLASFIIGKWDDMEINCIDSETGTLVLRNQFLGEKQGRQ